jgi:adenosine deaminase
MKVLLREEDFYDLTMAYLKKAVSENVRHAEIFFDPQAHTGRGVAFETVLDGITYALNDGKRELGISSGLILCFLRDMSAESAMETLLRALPYKDRIIAVGLDSAEVGYPPGKFKEVFDVACREGFLTVAHAGEEGPPEYIWEALDVLMASRIDHGIQCQRDEKLMQHLIETQTPLTVCPISNVKLRIFDKISDHNFKYLLEHGLCVSIHSDDPAYFGSYVEENYIAVKDALGLSRPELAQAAINSFTTSFLSAAEKQRYIDEIERLL